MMPIRERDGKWHYRFWLDGREYTGSTDLAATGRNENAARRIEARSRDLVKGGRAHELKLEITPFPDATAQFLKWAEAEHQKHPSTAKRLGTSFASLKIFFGRCPVSTILRGDVRDYMAWRRSEHHIKEITLRHDLHALSKAFGYWVDHNWARDNPVRGVEIPSANDAVRLHVLSAAEEETYFHAARRWSNLYDLGRLMMNQGCRPEEILMLETSDVDLERSAMTIRFGKTTAARRRLRLTTESRAILARRLSSATAARWVFPSPKQNGRPLTKLNGPHEKALELTRKCKGCGKIQMEHLKKGGCEYMPGDERLEFVIYDFRHTFATRAAEAGMPIATLAALLGHADLRSVMKYVHIRQEAQDEAMAEFEQKVLVAKGENTEPGEHFSNQKTVIA